MVPRQTRPIFPSPCQPNSKTRFWLRHGEGDPLAKVWKQGLWDWLAGSRWCRKSHGLIACENHRLESIELFADEIGVGLQSAELRRCRSTPGSNSAGSTNPAVVIAAAERSRIVDEVMAKTPEEVVDHVRRAIVVAGDVGPQRIRHVVVNRPGRIPLLIGSRGSPLKGRRCL